MIHLIHIDLIHRKLAGKICRTALMSATSYVGDSPLFVFDYLLRLLRVAVLMSLWRTLFAHPSSSDPSSPDPSNPVSVGGMTLPLLLTYTLIAEAFAEQLSASTDVAWAFWDGTIATRFVRPLSVFTQFIAEAAGKWAFNLVCFALPLLVGGGLMGIGLLPANPLAGLLALLSLLLGISIGLALDFLLTAVAIGLQFPPFALERVRAAIAALASGAFIPLALMPWGLGRLMGWLPFASIASAPLRLYTGTGTAQELLPLQLLWATLLWPLTLWLWRVNQERMVSYGG